MAILTIILSIAAIVLLITKLKLHPFLALLLVSIALGLLFGMKTELIISSIQDGFGGTLGKIGLVIILGVMIGAFLENSGVHWCWPTKYYLSLVRKELQRRWVLLVI